MTSAMLVGENLILPDKNIRIIEHYTVTFDTSIWYQTIVIPQNIQIS